MTVFGCSIDVRKNKREITHNITKRRITIQGHKQDINIVKLI